MKYNCDPRFWSWQIGVSSKVVAQIGPYLELVPAFLTPWQVLLPNLTPGLLMLFSRHWSSGSRRIQRHSSPLQTDCSTQARCSPRPRNVWMEKSSVNNQWFARIVLGATRRFKNIRAHETPRFELSDITWSQYRQGSPSHAVRTFKTMSRYR